MFILSLHTKAGTGLLLSSSVKPILVFPGFTVSSHPVLGIDFGDSPVQRDFSARLYGLHRRWDDRYALLV